MRKIEAKRNGKNRGASLSHRTMLYRNMEYEAPRPTKKDFCWLYGSMTLWR
jgi:hypothetical protein